MSRDWTLHVSLRGPYGECYEIATPLADSVIQEVARIDPPLQMPVGVEEMGAFMKRLSVE